MGRFDNKVVVISGGGQGIGRCLTLSYAAEGAKVGRQSPPIRILNVTTVFIKVSSNCRIRRRGRRTGGSNDRNRAKNVCPN